MLAVPSLQNSNFDHFVLSDRNLHLLDEYLLVSEWIQPRRSVNRNLWDAIANSALVLSLSKLTCFSSSARLSRTALPLFHWSFTNWGTSKSRRFFLGATIRRILANAALCNRTLLKQDAQTCLNCEFDSQQSAKTCPSHETCRVFFMDVRTMGFLGLESLAPALTELPGFPKVAPDCFLLSFRVGRTFRTGVAMWLSSA